MIYKQNNSYSQATFEQTSDDIVIEGIRAGKTDSDAEGRKEAKKQEQGETPLPSTTDVNTVGRGVEAVETSSGKKTRKRRLGDEPRGHKEEGGDQDEPDFVQKADLKRPRGWSAWEDKTKQRPAPLNPPRVQDLQYANMTIRAIENEDGAQIFSQYKDIYMRSEVQLKRSEEAQGDQRKVAGGVYTCLEDGQDGFELALRKGYKTKTVGIVLRHRAQEKVLTVFDSFADMEYEYFLFSKHTDGLRYRQKCPRTTPTGYIWTGVGAEMPLPDCPSSDVFVFCERADRDIHFSEGSCERITQAPGASQSICSNAACGQVSWHLSRKCFQRVSDHQFIEVWQEDFALITFRSGAEKLLWTHPHRRLKRSWWARQDNSPQHDGFIPDAGSRKRAQENFKRLPPWQFDPPSYVPAPAWTDPTPLLREADNSCW